MGHRSIVAYERTDQTYSLHYSHHGGQGMRLRDSLAATSPFGDGSNATWATEAIDQIRTGEPISSDTIDGSNGSVEVDPIPKSNAESFTEIGNNYVNYLHYEALYVVHLDWTIEVWLPLWFGLTYDCSRVTEARTVGNGALVEIPDNMSLSVDHQELQTKWTTLKDTIGDGIDSEWIPPREVESYLQEKLRKWVRPGYTCWFSNSCSLGSFDC